MQCYLGNKAEDCSAVVIEHEVSEEQGQVISARESLLVAEEVLATHLADAILLKLHGDHGAYNPQLVVTVYQNTSTLVT